MVLYYECGCSTREEYIALLKNEGYTERDIALGLRYINSPAALPDPFHLEESHF